MELRELTCKEVILDLLSDYLDAILSLDLVESLERHLRDCPPCVSYLNTYKKTRDLTGKVGRVEMPEEMKARLRQFLLEYLAKGKP